MAPGKVRPSSSYGTDHDRLPVLPVSWGWILLLTSRGVSVGYLPENPAFYDYLTAEEYLAFVGKAFAMQDEILPVAALQEVLKRLDLVGCAQTSDARLQQRDGAAGRPGAGADS